MILSIETSTQICSLAIHAQGALLAKTNVHVQNSHALAVNRGIAFLTDVLNIRLHDLDAIAVSEGPGSYTGLRIGVSSAKGLCFALNKPLITISTLQSMAAGVQASGSVLRCPMIDARRMEVYTALYDSSLTAVLDVQPMVLDDESFAGVLEEHTIIFFGDGSYKYESLQTHPNAIFIKHGLPDAQFVGGLAYEKYENGLFADVAYFEPFYLKEFRATKPKQKF